MEAETDTTLHAAAAATGAGGGGSDSSSSSSSSSNDQQCVVAKIRKIYANHNPSKMDELDSLLDKYKGKEEEMLIRLRRKYQTASNLLNSQYEGYSEEYEVSDSHIKLVFEGHFKAGKRVVVEEQPKNVFAAIASARVAALQESQRLAMEACRQRLSARPQGNILVLLSEIHPMTKISQDAFDLLTSLRSEMEQQVGVQAGASKEEVVGAFRAAFAQSELLTHAEGSLKNSDAPPLGIMLDYFLEELLELGGNAARNFRSDTIAPWALREAIREDEGLKEFFAAYSSNKHFHFEEEKEGGDKIDIFALARRNNAEGVLAVLDKNPECVNDRDMASPIKFTLMHYLCFACSVDESYLPLTEQVLGRGASLAMMIDGVVKPLYFLKGNDKMRERIKAVAASFASPVAVEAKQDKEEEDQRWSDDCEYFCDDEEAKFDQNNSTLLLWNAVNLGDVMLARLALACGASPCALTYPNNGAETDADKLLVGTTKSKGFKIEDIDYHQDDGRPPQQLTAFVTIFMRACQRGDCEMIRALVNDSKEPNLVNVACMPKNISVADGYAFGGITPLVCGLHDLATTKLLVELGVDLNATIQGLVGYEDIPSPLWSPLLLSGGGAPHEAGGEGEAISKYLVEAGADVNYGASFYTGGQGGDTSLCCYWLYVVASGDVAWAEKCITLHRADVNWPRSLVQKGSGGEAKMSVDNDSDDEKYGCRFDFIGLGATALMTAIRARDAAMVALLIKHGADVNLSEFVYYREGEGCHDDEDLSDEAYQFAIDRASPLSLAIGCAGFTMSTEQQQQQEAEEEEQKQEQEQAAKRQKTTKNSAKKATKKQAAEEAKADAVGGPFSPPSSMVEADAIIKLLVQAGAVAHANNALTVKHPPSAALTRDPSDNQLGLALDRFRQRAEAEEVAFQEQQQQQQCSRQVSHKQTDTPTNTTSTLGDSTSDY